jgi:gamma-glutamyltranspeptidase/glutathione hydrolase
MNVNHPTFYKPTLLKTAIICFFAGLISFSHAQTSMIGEGKTINPYQYQIVKTKTFSRGAVSSAHPLASLVGAEMLKKGGNAYDAAIATQLVLAVVYPQAGNIGGGGFLVGRMVNGKTITIDYRETAPAKASRDMYVNPTTGKADTSQSQNGVLSSGVPGTIAGLFATLKYAKLPFRMLIQPAIDIAAMGYCITQAEANLLNQHRLLFQKNNSQTPVFIATTAWKKGDTLIQKDLAKTLTRIRDNGQKGFYEGETAKLIVEEMKRGKGFITYQDLKQYKAKERKALQFNYKGYTIIGMPPPSSGGLLLWQMMKMVEKRPLPVYGFQTAKSVQLMIEAERRAYADRAEHLGDPDFYKVPLKTITSEKYLAKRMADYDSTKASSSKNVGAGQVIESDETTHLSVFDQWGNMVSVTTTLNGYYGSKTVVGDAGFFLNDEMDDFSVQAGVANMFGAIGGEANAIAPGKRMLSSMTPTLVLKNNKPYIVVGTPGGTTIPTSVFQALINVIDYNMTGSDAVNKPKFHHQWLPDVVRVEKTFPTDVRLALEQMGYTIKERETIGRTELIRYLGKGKIEAVADMRGDDSVAGF